MKPYLLENLHCDRCGGELTQPGVDASAREAALLCASCGRSVRLAEGDTPLFTDPPSEMVPSEKIARGPEMGTPWRQANWRFIEQQVAKLKPDSLILDVGAGRGDFAEALKDYCSIALEVYPYPEVDVVCDLTQENPFKPARFDAILLLNVLEHVYDTHALIRTLASLLKPGGILIVAVPFMVKLHQVPVDYVRYTHFALQRLGEEHGLQVEHLEGYYDPVFFLGEGVGNLTNAILPELGKRAEGYFRPEVPFRNYRSSRLLLARIYVRLIQFLSNQLARALGPGRAQPPSQTKSMAPTGYQLVYKKVG